MTEIQKQIIREILKLLAGIKRKLHALIDE